MTLISSGLVGLVALLHLYFMILEMFFWTKPKGLKIFGQSLEQAKASQVLAQNQGLYNGFLVAGLLWSLFEPGDHANSLKFFFLGCVVVAGIFGGLTVNHKIFFVQALPALIAIGLVFVSGA